MNPLTDLNNKNVLVVGFGKTGKAMIRFLLDRGAVVTVNDSKTNTELSADIAPFKKDGATFILGGHPPEIFLCQDFIVLSPGVDPNLSPLRQAHERGIPLVSEIELASWFIRTPAIGITGTNGKTTTTSLLSEILRYAGFSVFTGGNIGNPLINFVQNKIKADFLVVELSSFQLEAIEKFCSHIAILLNITEDHLDRYSTFAAYCEAKYRIFLNQTKENFAIVNYDDVACRAIIPSLSARVLPFSQKKVLTEGMYSNGKFLYFRGEDDSVHAYRLAKVKLFGVHNQQNMLAAIGASEVCGCSPEKIQEALENFQGLHHRIEFVQEINGISFYNDSKATNIDALLKSLQSFSKNIILIAGGREKGGDYRVLKEEIKKKVKLLIAIGETQEKFCNLFGSVTTTGCATTLDEAVQTAFQSAAQGDIVLLSPACASFDMFANYEERGQKFIDAVRRLAHNKNDHHIDDNYGYARCIKE
jgi:UDP-N-acetylmuramoylalanine--D-glutamate ligase